MSKPLSKILVALHEDIFTYEEASEKIKDLMYKIYDEDFYTFKKNLEAL